jgi:hypothetical protein
MRPVLLLLLALLSLTPAAVAAKGLKATAAQEGSAYRYTAQWTEGKQKHKVTVDLPREAVEADLKAPLRFPREAAGEAQAKAVRKWADSLPKSTQLKVKASKNGSLSFSVREKSRSAATEALAKAEEIAKAELLRFATEKGFVVDEDNVILPDHAREAVESAPAVKALADALAEGLPPDDARAFANRALHFTQSIPYEKRKNGGDAGFRRPLSLLVRNKGDCDGKSVLFLALMRARFPTLPLAVVLVPEHAFVAVGLEAKSGERTVKEDGTELVLMEPVGPAHSAIGELSRTGKKGMRWGRDTVLRVKPSR